MKNKKIILLILVMFLFSGCTVKYNLYVNSDLSVNEKVIASEDTITIKKNTAMEPKVAANSLFDEYKIDGVKYSFTTVDGDTTKSTASTNFKTLEEYEDYFESDIVKNVVITRKDSYITIEYNQDVALSEYSSRSLIYDNIEVNIEVPFKVVEENADRVKGNTYTWNIEKNGKLKNIKITFNKDETDNSKKFNILGFFEINVKYTVLVGVGIVLAILILILVVYLRNQKNNRL